jgi:ADP-ribose pyrophosphatase
MREFNGPYQVLSRKPVFENPWLRVTEEQVLRPDGAPAQFGVVDVGAGVSALALDANQDVYLVREFKYAMRAETLEVVSGAVDPGESPLEAAQRELQEEAGLAAARWVDLGPLQPLTTIVHAPMRIFLAMELSSVTAGGDEGEFLTVVKMPLSGAREMALRGDIAHAATIVALLKASIWLEREASLASTSISPPSVSG